MSISIVIPNYNGEALLRKNLPKVIEAARAYNKGSVEIIVIDDGSIDKSLEILKDYDVKIIVNEKNLGFSSTINKGVRAAQGEIIVLLNTDVSPEKDFLSPLLKHFENPKLFAVGSMDKSIEDGKTVLRGRGIGKWKRGFLVHARGDIDKTNTLWVSGGSGAFRKSIWDRLGGFNELYNPFYWEDIDLSYRALKSGYKIRFEPGSVVIHRHEEGAIKKTNSQFQIKTVAYRNQFIFAWRNATDLDLQFLHILWLPYHFVKALFRWDMPYFIGFFAAFIRLLRIIQSSFKAQKLFVKSDKDVIQNFA